MSTEFITELEIGYKDLERKINELYGGVCKKWWQEECQQYKTMLQRYPVNLLKSELESLSSLKDHFQHIYGFLTPVDINIKIEYCNQLLKNIPQGSHQPPRQPERSTIALPVGVPGVTEQSLSLTDDEDEPIIEEEARRLQLAAQRHQASVRPLNRR